MALGVRVTPTGVSFDEQLMRCRAIRDSERVLQDGIGRS